jgi:hypothetical protein
MTTIKSIQGWWFPVANLLQNGCKRLPPCAAGLVEGRPAGPAAASASAPVSPSSSVVLVAVATVATTVSVVVAVAVAVSVLVTLFSTHKN